MTSIHRLFIYGTLAPGRPNEHILKPLNGTWQPATVKGFLKQQGWGKDLGYPGIELDNNGDTIEGFLFTSEHLASFWQQLDAFEGEEYQRVLVKVFVNDEEVTAYIYQLKKS